MFTNTWKPIKCKLVKFRKTKLGNTVIFPRYAKKEIKYHSFFKLGNFESKVFFLCDGKHTVNELANNLFNEIEDENIPKEKVISETNNFLLELKKHGIIE